MEAIRELTGGMGASVGLETSGNAEARSQVLRPCGPLAVAATWASAARRPSTSRET